jgi:transcription elongation factor
MQTSSEIYCTHTARMLGLAMWLDGPFSPRDPNGHLLHEFREGDSLRVKSQRNGEGITGTVVHVDGQRVTIYSPESNCSFQARFDFFEPVQEIHSTHTARMPAVVMWLDGPFSPRDPNGLARHEFRKGDSLRVKKPGNGGGITGTVVRVDGQRVTIYSPETKCSVEARFDFFERVQPRTVYRRACKK